MEFIAMVTDIGKPARKLTYKGDRGVVTSNDSKTPECITYANSATTLPFRTQSAASSSFAHSPK